MPKPIVTKLFFASLAGSVMGAVIAAGPLFWSMMKIDLSSTTEVEGGAVPLFFGLFEFNYSSLVLLVNEALLCGSALGVSASLMWFETRLDGAQLGSIADIASGLNALGAIFALFLFIGIVQVNQDPAKFNENFIKYIQAAYILVVGLVFSYFFAILQMRRVKDIEYG